VLGKYLNFQKTINFGFFLNILKSENYQFWLFEKNQNQMNHQSQKPLKTCEFMVNYLILKIFFTIVITYQN